MAAIENTPAKTPTATADMTVRLLDLFRQTFFQAMAVIITKDLCPKGVYNLKAENSSITIYDGNGQDYDDH